MTRFIIRWAINAVALFAAIALIKGIHLTPGSNWVTIVFLALIFGLVNALVRPLLKALTCPLIVLTLGLFTLVVNTLLFALTGWIGTQFGMGFTIDPPWFWNAFLGSLIVSIISIVLALVLKDEIGRRRFRS